MTVAGLPSSGFASGGDTQSMAFLSTPEKERLYSGTAKISASASLTRSRRVGGGWCNAPRHMVEPRIFDGGLVRLNLKEQPGFTLHHRGALGAVRTFEVHAGQDVMIPIVGVTDSEGPGINPTIPNFAPTN
jgi:hypothetical protein